MTPAENLPYNPFAPVDLGVARHEMLFGNAYPEAFGDWRDEVMSWKTGAYLTAALNPTLTFRLSGPDALRLLSDHSVNGLTRFPVDAARHLIMCNPAGQIVAHGICVREGEESFLTYWLMPWVSYLAESGRYRVTGENLTGRVFLFQVAGPRSLAVLQAATGEDLRDIRFLRRRATRIAGCAVHVLRVGMAGSLAYEVHGPAEAAHAVYRTLLAAGSPLGLRQLGRTQYRMNHTENGFPQGHVHFLYPWFEDADFARYLTARSGGTPFKTDLRGSAGPDPSLRYRTPVEVGWGHVIRLDHDFMGRQALEAELAAPRRLIATLTWNPEDVLDIYRSYLTEGTPHPFMDFRIDMPPLAQPAPHVSDLVLKDGNVVGISSGRVYSYRYRKMISLASLDAGLAVQGTEVVVLWGDPGTRQREIRAVVDRYPLFDEGRNEDVDVSGPEFAPSAGAAPG
ncbi:Glycine cleavage system T protein (aminomethyltransferase) [Rubellimicrobium thermophilum DSM 16684]|uniref:Glycine cleavage system T protein (Aminomethyltransferase) n=1 Tax=Rubellimicrobium thermophilum DSM 16684 TaxID=1123069 RepID=S9QU63_9RHOB|nr:aminomethyltransferase family protein [Rubellimicrobium thermophilum]EPX84926.1 Glycine cleavage system T protein (aminomethyltransferase) [Rubellimicrobium thermophilum DSM 16684]